MAVDPISEGPRITPYLLYEDVAKALEWLAKAFGFIEQGDRFTGPDGKVSHASMKLGDGVIMMGRPGSSYKNPKRLGQATQHLYVYVENVDSLFERARAMGASVLEEPKDALTATGVAVSRTPKGTSGSLRSMFATCRPRRCSAPPRARSERLAH